jgi:hypothetical protein
MVTIHPRVETTRPEKLWQPLHALHRSNSFLTEGCSREAHRPLQLRRTQVFPPNCMGKEGMIPCGLKERPSKAVSRVGDGDKTGLANGLPTHQRHHTGRGTLINHRTKNILGKIFHGVSHYYLKCNVVREMRFQVGHIKNDRS